MPKIPKLLFSCQYFSFEGHQASISRVLNLGAKSWHTRSPTAIKKFAFGFLDLQYIFVANHAEVEARKIGPPL